MTAPRYEQVAQAIRSELPEPGEMLPSETELCEQYGGASRSTIRRALDLLENEGLITSSQGQRRLVRDVRRWSWEMTRWEQQHSDTADAWANNIADQGGQPTQDVQVAVLQATREVAEALAIETGDPVVVRKRVRRIDGRPHHLSDSYFPRWITDQHPEFSIPGDQAVAGGLLAAAGHPQARKVDTITARMPTPEEANLLQTGRGVPLLIHSRVGYDADNQPVRLMVTRMAADKVDLSYEVND